ncbi:hypothetical protein FHX15_003627 [Rhizobium sp. BK650]|nr:hypothetical protein [Rhizobium sp. BK650]
MSRLTDTPAKADPLQRSESACAVSADPSHPLFAGLAASHRGSGPSWLSPGSCR